MIQKICTDCNGSGELWDENTYIDCPTCLARGLIWTDLESVEDYMADCPRCAGTRIWDDDDCPVCDGDGEVLVWGIAEEPIDWPEDDYDDEEA